MGVSDQEKIAPTFVAQKVSLIPSGKHKVLDREYPACLGLPDGARRHQVAHRLDSPFRVQSCTQAWQNRAQPWRTGAWPGSGLGGVWWRVELERGSRTARHTNKQSHQAAVTHRMRFDLNVAGCPPPTYLEHLLQVSLGPLSCKNGRKNRLLTCQPFLLCSNTFSIKNTFISKPGDPPPPMQSCRKGTRF